MRQDAGPRDGPLCRKRRQLTARGSHPYLSPSGCKQRLGLNSQSLRDKRIGSRAPFTLSLEGPRGGLAEHAHRAGRDTHAPSLYLRGRYGKEVWLLLSYSSKCGNAVRRQTVSLKVEIQPMVRRGMRYLRACRRLKMRKALD